MDEASAVPHVEAEPASEPSVGSRDHRPASSPNGDGGAESTLAQRPHSLPEARPFFGFTRGDQLFLALLSTVALALMLWHWARLSGWGLRPVEVDRLEPQSLDYRIDVNTATWVEWTQLDGIGEALAERIVADRKANGPFGSVDELRRVKGIGPKTLARIRRYLTVGKPAEKTR